MNWTQIEAKWDEIKGKIQQQWGELTEDDLAAIRGRRDQLVTKLKQRYAMEKDEAEREIDRTIERL